jgi:hypothetical protein
VLLFFHNLIIHHLEGVGAHAELAAKGEVHFGEQEILRGRGA